MDGTDSRCDTDTLSSDDATLLVAENTADSTRVLRILSLGSDDIVRICERHSYSYVLIVPCMDGLTHTHPSHLLQPPRQVYRVGCVVCAGVAADRVHQTELHRALV